MIVNSQPYNPSQQSQQQRCIGINQQNSLYGSRLAQIDMPQASQQHQHRPAPNHMFDLALLQQEQQPQATNNTNLFDSAYDDATNSLATAATFNHHSDHIQPASQNGKMMNGHTSNKQHQTTDVSLYSPSSSTSLLYHHYDQINVPTDHHSANNQNSNNTTTNNNNNNIGNFKRSNTTTVLNPANLFGQTTMSNNNQHALSAQQTNQQQHFLNNNKTTIPQQELYSSGTQYHLHQPSFNHTLHHHHHLQQQHNSAYGLDNHQFMLDTILRQQHAAVTTATAAPRAPQHGYHHRPLSSSGASSMSGQSMALTYGRQPRQVNGQLPPLPPINSSKSQNTLASVLQSNQTLNHLGLSLNGHLTPTMTDTRGPKKMSHHQYSPSASGVGGASGALTSRKWKRAQQRVQNFAYEHGTLLRCCMLFILLAFTVMSVVKFTSLNNPSTTVSQNQPQNPIFNYNQQISSHNSNNAAQINMNPLVHSPTKLMDLATRPDVDINKWAVTEQYLGGESSTVSPDVLSSKLLIGEFVIISQNYTNSEAQRSAMAENIVKLMDQVFLSTDVRRVYSRMQVIEIRPHIPSGIVVKCNIILSESIIYAAQQFGIALYDSLAKSNEKLANQPNFIIDRSSIRFNTIPDKDLAIVPPQLLPAVLTRTDAAQPSPSDGLGIGQHQQRLEDLKPEVVAGNQPQDQNAVVWSEWSQWSSCVDKNGMCDPTRLHSRLRKCVSQLTGDKVEAAACRQRFNMQDLELEVTDCSTTCANSQQQVQSDAPLVIVPNTAPSMIVNGQASEPTFMLPTALNRAIKQNGASQQPSAQRIGPFDPIGSNGGGLNSNAMEIYSNGGSSINSDSTNVQQLGAMLTSTQSSTSTATQDQSSLVVSSPTQASAPIVPTMAQLDNQQQQMSCSNCTSDEICLLLITQKVPFCAKIKDRLDESGCGGWCKAQDQLCQPAGQNAFKCTHNSECLPDEWRCHDSACIPASKRCDGHENCFDSSDERYCPSNSSLSSHLTANYRQQQ